MKTASEVARELVDKWQMDCDRDTCIRTKDEVKLEEVITKEIDKRDRAIERIKKGLKSLAIQVTREEYKEQGGDDLNDVRCAEAYDFIIEEARRYLKEAQMIMEGE